MSKSAFTVGLLFLLLATPALAGTVNKSIKVGAGEVADGASSVNGSITVGEGAQVTGDVSTVNGSIRVDTGATIESASTVNGGVRVADKVQAEDLETVNGTIRVGEASVIDGYIEAVNGRIKVGKGSTVASDVENVNGEIQLVGAEIGGDVSTVSGDIYLTDEAVVNGNIVVEKPGGWSWGKKRRTPRIVIGPGSRVEGVIDVEYEVDLFISETASVGGVHGKMSMDDAVRFSGDKP
ncbi:MAG: hypothetical protein AAFN50_05280 [Pseudomonadota bacterium]